MRNTKDSDLNSATEISAQKERALALLVLLGKLEGSLHGSREALLKADLSSMERETCEQAGFIRELNTVLQSGQTTAPGKRASDPAVCVLLAGQTELAEELRQSRERILKATRLQAALLARAQNKLRVMVNMLAGPSITYGPFSARNRFPASDPPIPERI